MKKLNINFYAFLFIALGLLSFSCKSDKSGDESQEKDSVVMKTIKIEKKLYGTTPDGKTVDQYTLGNGSMEVDIITYGGIITSLRIPDKQGNVQDVVLGFDSLSEYIANNPYFGALIGRYGNRIANATFNLDGVDYELVANNGPNHLHGGTKGFDKVVWTASEFENEDAFGIKLTYLSADGEEGYPGNLEVTVTYSLLQDNTLEVLYEAVTDKKTVVNLTQHTYFNLSADFSKPILDHEVSINADQYLPVDETLIPLGELASVEGTPFDFRASKKIGNEIDADNEQIKRGLGYDHCWVLNEQDQGMRSVATAYHAGSGRQLEVLSDEPGVQFYTGNFLDGTLTAKGGGTYAQRTGFCLETQHYPDSPNQEQFPSVVLEPGDKYSTKTAFKFTTK